MQTRKAVDVSQLAYAHSPFQQVLDAAERDVVRKRGAPSYWQRVDWSWECYSPVSRQTENRAFSNLWQACKREPLLAEVAA